MTRTKKDEEKIGGGIGGMLAITIGLALVGLGVFLVLSFATADVYLDPAESAKTCWTGLLGAWISFGVIHTVGRIPAVVLAILVVFWGLNSARNQNFLATWPQVFGGIVMLAALSMGLCAFSDRYDMSTGGLFAIYLSPPAILYFGRWGLAVASAVVLFLGVLLTFGESAVFGIRGALISIKEFIFGFVGTFGRLGELLRLLITPRLAVAGAQSSGSETIADKRSRFGAGKQKNPGGETPGSEDDDSVGVDAEDSTEEKKKKRKETVKVWQPREEFKSRFLALDLRSDQNKEEQTGSQTDAAEEVAAKLAAEPETREEATPSAEPKTDVIMDVDAEAEESDEIEPVAVEPAYVDEKLSIEQNRGKVVDMTPEPEPVKQAEPEPRPVPAAPRPQVEKPRPAAQMKTAAAAADKNTDKSLADYVLPPIEILDPPEPPPAEDRAELERCAKILEQTLSEFKIEGRVVHIERGPRVTMYEISLAPGIRLSKVTSLSDNIAMQLKAESVRIIAPIPGKDTIGIEIPNSEKELVSLREIVAAVNREKRRQALPICLGKDVSGASLVADLAKMPHLLIAGATGSGKSVCINSIIMSVMMCCKPDEAQLIMIDPKVVELSRFKDIPHLMCPVITDMKRAVSVLEWICQKMDERYEQMSQVSVNNIAKFNALGEAEIRERLDAFSSLEEIESFPKSMPYMIVVIDELADLMMVAGKEVEQHITRLAAKSRAVGIHLILATQRPSVDVITGLIKANMPCRIAFQVASRVDSRTILDQNGAESLLGAGDMLYLPPGVGKLTRAQGVFVSDEELFRTVDYTKAQAEPQYHSDLLGPVIGGSSGDVDISSFDELFLQAGEAIIENQRGSVSLLQRKFGIGYGRASRIIDQLASAGLLGPFRDGKAREILMTMEEFDVKFRGGSAASGWEDDEEGSLAGLREDELEPGQDPWTDM